MILIEQNGERIKNDSTWVLVINGDSIAYLVSHQRQLKAYRLTRLRTFDYRIVYAINDQGRFSGSISIHLNIIVIEIITKTYKWIRTVSKYEVKLFKQDLQTDTIRYSINPVPLKVDVP